MLPVAPATGPSFRLRNRAPDFAILNLRESLQNKHVLSIYLSIPGLLPLCINLHLVVIKLSLVLCTPVILSLQARCVP